LLFDKCIIGAEMGPAIVPPSPSSDFISQFCQLHLLLYCSYDVGCIVDKQSAACGATSRGGTLAVTVVFGGAQSGCCYGMVCPTLMILPLGMEAHTSVSQTHAIVEFRDSFITTVSQFNAYSLKGLL
jgi:hypothetical protein